MKLTNFNPRYNLRRSESAPRETYSRDLFNEFDRFFSTFEDNVLGFQNSKTDHNEISLNPSVEVEETDQAYLLSFDLPGVKESDIKIDLQKNHLKISAERRKEQREGQNFLQKSYGRYERTFILPEGIQDDQVEAHHADGVLTIALPKAAPIQARSIQVKKGEQGLLDRWFGKKETEKDAKTH